MILISLIVKIISDHQIIVLFGTAKALQQVEAHFGLQEEILWSIFQLVYSVYRHTGNEF